MPYLTNINKAALFKYPTTHKLVPNRDTIILVIKSEDDFTHHVIRTTMNTNQKPFAPTESSIFFHGLFPRLSHTLNSNLKLSSKPLSMLSFKNKNMSQQLLPSQHHPSTQSSKLRHHVMIPPLPPLPLPTNHHPPRTVLLITSQPATRIPTSTKIPYNHPTLHQQRTPLMKLFHLFNAQCLIKYLKVKLIHTVVFLTIHPTRSFTSSVQTSTKQTSLFHHPPK